MSFDNGSPIRSKVVDKGRMGSALIVYQEELVVVALTVYGVDDLRLTDQLLPQQSPSSTTRSHAT